MPVFTRWAISFLSLSCFLNIYIYLSTLIESTYVVSGSCDHTIRVWEVATGECVGVLKGHTDWVVVVAFSPFSRRIGTYYCNSLLRLSSSRSFSKLHVVPLTSSIHPYHSVAPHKPNFYLINCLFSFRISRHHSEGRFIFVFSVLLSPLPSPSPLLSPLFPLPSFPSLPM